MASARLRAALKRRFQDSHFRLHVGHLSPHRRGRTARSDRGVIPTPSEERHDRRFRDPSDDIKGYRHPLRRAVDSPRRSADIILSKNGHGGPQVTGSARLTNRKQSRLAELSQRREVLRHRTPRTGADYTRSSRGVCPFWAHLALRVLRDKNCTTEARGTPRTDTEGSSPSHLSPPEVRLWPMALAGHDGVAQSRSPRNDSPEQELGKTGRRRYRQRATDGLLTLRRARGPTRSLAGGAQDRL
jgi:hypothetical protein